MKKKMILILSVLIVVSLLIVRFSDGVKTIEEAINPGGSQQIKIIHIEKNDKGSIVFSYTLENDGLYTAVVRKGIGGYKTVYSGYEGDIKRSSETFGITNSYYPGIKKTELPIYFGVIGDPNINEVKVVEKKRNIEGYAQIINAEDIRLWLIYMGEFEGSEFDIIGLTAEGEQLVKKDDNVAPYYAEQKPFNGYR